MDSDNTDEKQEVDKDKEFGDDLNTLKRRSFE